MLRKNSREEEVRRGQRRVAAEVNLNEMMSQGR